MNNYTLTETYTLPSKGLIYKEKIDPEITLRSMTTAEEMKRLSHTDAPYRKIAGIIDDCMIDKCKISSYDMCLGDYQFLLHKLRVVTYGKSYKLSLTCPYCGNIQTKEMNLDELKVLECPDDIEKYFDITLPVTGKRIKLKFQTPRSLDLIARKQREFKERAELDSTVDMSYLYLVESLIDEVEGERLDSVMLESFVRSLPMKDTNLIIKTSDKINNLVGIDATIREVCSRCGVPYYTTFPFTSEFFGPSID